jgi:hypothetical protein
MKSIVLISLFFCAAFTASAQITGTGQHLIKKKCGTDHISLSPEKYGQGYPDLFHSIRVVDFRRDTSRIGIVRVGNKSQDQVLFGLPVSVQVKEYLDAAYGRAKGSHSLLIVLKDLWISAPDSLVGRNYNQWNLAFHAEAYLMAKDGYQPLTFIDTVLEGLRGLSIQATAEENLRELIAAFMDQLATQDLDRDRMNVSYRQIDSFGRVRFSYPMDTATQFVNGVYTSIEEFRNNSPSIAKYELSKDGSGNFDLRIPDENGQLYLTHTVWGYCDGKQAYVMIQGSLYPVFMVGHQFYVLGSKEHRYSRLWVEGVQLTDDLVKTLRLFRVDIDSGKVAE